MNFYSFFHSQMFDVDFDVFEEPAESRGTKRDYEDNLILRDKPSSKLGESSTILVADELTSSVEKDFTGASTLDDVTNSTEETMKITHHVCP